jgi:hypothetical protein
VTCCNYPWRLISVYSGKIFGQPGKLGTAGSEWTGKFGTLSTRLIRCIWEVSFGVELNKVDHSMIPGVPEIPNAAGNVRRHAEWQVRIHFNGCQVQVHTSSGRDIL